MLFKEEPWGAGKSETICWRSEDDTGCSERIISYSSFVCHTCRKEYHANCWTVTPLQALPTKGLNFVQDRLLALSREINECLLYYKHETEWIILCFYNIDNHSFVYMSKFMFVFVNINKDLFCSLRAYVISWRLMINSSQIDSRDYVHISLKIGKNPQNNRSWFFS